MVSFARCVSTEEQTCLEIDRTEEFFKLASLYIFTPHHQALMNEIEKSSESAHDLAESIYRYTSYRKAVEFKLDKTYFVRSTMEVQLTEIKLFDDMMYPAFTETTSNRFL